MILKESAITMTTNYAEKTVLVAGGTGGVGEGIVKWFIDQGSTVIVPSRSVEKGNHLRAYIGENQSKLISIEGDISNEADALRIRQEIEQRFGKVDAVIATLGGWWQGKSMLMLSVEEWQHLLNTNLTSHVVAAKTFLPLIRQHGSYTFIAGISSEIPYPGAGPIAIAGSGQLMLRKVLSAEIPRQVVRINDIMLAPINTRNRSALYQDDSYLSSIDVGRVADYLAFGSGKTLSNETIRVMNQQDLHQLLR